MKRVHVESSALESIGYDTESQTLELEFRDNGGVWQYFNFKPSAFKKFIDSDSLGRFFVKKIKGKFKERRMP
ncbi:KTSC domain-containing protein [Mucilaginibacter sp. UR6-1]|uniref:KTSC domain-containing protein n=1 Tax=Mucilaginibacter sp. UR6-1 TaxID=1435643 RepID=UPI001E4D17DD|nr:KTSC domain-containing protein [Mucilaginibacter sp. UR6-1]MCC8409735.1 KTSC domain-containing protein [Mucilaginibacter sp. UR6-1]